MENIAFETLAFTLLDAVLVYLLGWASYKFSRWTGVQIEEKHARALHEALMSGAQAAWASSPRAAIREVMDQAIAHAQRSVPDAIGHLNPPTTVLRTIARRKVEETRPLLGDQ